MIAVQNNTQLKSINTLLIKSAIAESAMITKPQLAKKLDLSLVTVNKLVDELVARKEILDMGQTESTGGRKAKLYTLNKDYNSMLAVLIRNDMAYLSIVNLIGETCYKTSFPYCDDWIYRLKDYIFIEDLPPVACVGVAIPGTVLNGIIKNVPSIPKLEGVPLEEVLKKELKLPVLIENDINIAALGTHRALIAHQKETCTKENQMTEPPMTENHINENDASNMVLIYVNKGVGMGIILKNQIYQSIRNFAGELAYMYLGDDYKNIEQYIINCLKSGEIMNALDALSKIIANVCCVLDPDMVVIDSPILKQEHISVIESGISAITGQDFLPRLELLSSNEEVYHQGLYFLYMERENLYRR